jgi:hypothetical protein
MSFSCLHAQVDLPKNFLYLYSDSLISGDRIIYESEFDGSSHFIVDSRRIHPEQVKFFQNEMGFFANTHHFDIIGQTAFTERIREGKLNLYEGNFTGGQPYHPYYNRHAYLTNEETHINYYNIGLGDLKKANYENLIKDLAGNQQSMSFLEQYRKTHSLSRKLLFIGGVAILAGFVSFIANGTRNVEKSSRFPEPGWIDRVPGPKFGLSFGLLLGGAGFSGAGLLKSLTKSKYLKQAVDSYNYSH